MEDDKINKTDDLSKGNLEGKENDSEPKENIDLVQSKGESGTEHKVIHKKDGRLHIYVRQDKYKGELKSKNWVGRLYINGKQKISSSGTQNLEEAIPKLEKWFDDIHAQQSIEQNKKEQSAVDDKSDSTKEEIVYSQNDEATVQKESQSASLPEKTVKLSMFDKLKNIKFGKSKKENSSNTTDKKTGKSKLSSYFKNIFQSKVSKLSVAGEEIAGLDITREGLSVCQVSQDKEEKWILDKFSYRLFDQEKIAENILDS